MPAESGHVKQTTLLSGREPQRDAQLAAVDLWAAGARSHVRECLRDFSVKSGVALCPSAVAFAVSAHSLSVTRRP